MMTLQQFMLAVNERPWGWLGIRSWRPVREKRYSLMRLLGVVVGFALVGFVAAKLVLSILYSLSGVEEENFSRLIPLFRFDWLAVLAAEFAGLAGLSWGLISRACWNGRARRLETSPESGTEVPPSSRGVRVATGLISLFYLFLTLGLTPLLLFHAVEDVRGNLAYQAKRASLKAAGECLDLSCLAPHPVPEDQNFFATPFWRQFEYERVVDAKGNPTTRWTHGLGGEFKLPYQTNFSLPDVSESFREKYGDKTRGITSERVDLRDWAEHFRKLNTRTNHGKFDPPISFPVPDHPGEPAGDVLFALSKFDPILTEISEASRRPRSVYPTHYDEGFDCLLPHLAAARSAAKIFQLRAAARLQAGEIQGAFEDVRVVFRLDESFKDEPILICQFVRFAIQSIGVKGLWEGLADHRWTDSQLSEFQHILSNRSNLSGILHAIEGERVFGLDTAERALHGPGRLVVDLRFLDRLNSVENNNTGSDDMSGLIVSLAPWIVPAGLVRQNQLVLLDAYHFFLDFARFDLNSTNRAAAVALAATDPIQTYLHRIHDRPISPFTLISRILLTAMDKVTDGVNRRQTYTEMAIVACALERYRLAHGTFPSTLDALAPTLLDSVPRDWMGGQPLHYQRTDDGWYRLWSVGLNGKDDGGTVQPSPPGLVVFPQLDWPWPSPVPSADRRLF